MAGKRSTTLFWAAGITAIGVCIGFGVFALAVGRPEVAAVFAVIGLASVATLPGVRQPGPRAAPAAAARSDGESP